MVVQRVLKRIASYMYGAIGRLAVGALPEEWIRMRLEKRRPFCLRRTEYLAVYKRLAQIFYKRKKALQAREAEQVASLLELVIKPEHMHEFTEHIDLIIRRARGQKIDKNHLLRFLEYLGDKSGREKSEELLNTEVEVMNKIKANVAEAEAETETKEEKIEDLNIKDNVTQISQQVSIEQPEIVGVLPGTISDDLVARMQRQNLSDTSYMYSDVMYNGIDAHNSRIFGSHYRNTHPYLAIGPYDTYLEDQKYIKSLNTPSDQYVGEEQKAADIFMHAEKERQRKRALLEEEDQATGKRLFAADDSIIEPRDKVEEKVEDKTENTHEKEVKVVEKSFTPTPFMFSAETTANPFADNSSIDHSRKEEEDSRDSMDSSKKQRSEAPTATQAAIGTSTFLNSGKTKNPFRFGNITSNPFNQGTNIFNSYEKNTSTDNGSTADVFGTSTSTIDPFKKTRDSTNPFASSGASTDPTKHENSITNTADNTDNADNSGNSGNVYGSNNSFGGFSSDKPFFFSDKNTPSRTAPSMFDESPKKAADITQAPSVISNVPDSITNSSTGVGALDNNNMSSSNSKESTDEFVITPIPDNNDNNEAMHKRPENPFVFSSPTPSSIFPNPTDSSFFSSPVPPPFQFSINTPTGIPEDPTNTSTAPFFSSAPQQQNRQELGTQEQALNNTSSLDFSQPSLFSSDTSNPFSSKETIRKRSFSYRK